MEPVFRIDYEISTIHLDCFGRVKPSVLLYFAQEAAGAHCQLLGTDWDTLQEKNLFWALIRTRLQISRQAQEGDVLTVETWPMPTTRTAFPRCTVAHDQLGREVFRCVSLWVLMDTQSRAMILPGKSGVQVPGILRGTELDSPRSLPPALYTRQVQRQVRFSELDRNGHMNNTRYLDWVSDLLPGEFHRSHPVQEVTLCYLSEAREEETMLLCHGTDPDGAFTVDAHRVQADPDREKERIFAAKVRYL